MQLAPPTVAAVQESVVCWPISTSTTLLQWSLSTDSSIGPVQRDKANYYALIRKYNKTTAMPKLNRMMYHLEVFVIRIMMKLSDQDHHAE